MISPTDITFICHVRLDNKAREKNVDTIYAYYKKHLPGCKFIFVEDCSEGWLDLTLDKNDEYVKVLNAKAVKKCECYNTGAKLAKTNILIFLDIDIVVDCVKLLECINESLANNTLECLIGYNGCAFYMTQAGEEEFLKTLDIKHLYEKIKEMRVINNNANEFALIGNTEAVGGCLVMTKQSFEKINGFNPFFNGWGFEDNEIILRAHKLGLQVTKSNILHHFLYHLPHSDPLIDKSQHSHYKSNEAIFNFVSCLDQKLLLNYIKQW